MGSHARAWRAGRLRPGKGRPEHHHGPQAAVRRGGLRAGGCTEEGAGLLSLHQAFQHNTGQVHGFRPGCRIAAVKSSCVQPRFAGGVLRGHQQGWAPAAARRRRSVLHQKCGALGGLCAHRCSRGGVRPAVIVSWRDMSFISVYIG